MVIVLIITAVRVKSMDSHRISGRILAENIAGPGMMRLVEQSMQAQAQKTSVTEIAVKEWKHPQAALTFDDGPDIRYTPLLLDGLKERRDYSLRLRIEVMFLDERTCKMTFKDVGFGEFFEASDFQVEKVIHLGGINGQFNSMS